MALWKQFHELVLPSVQGCPTGIVDSAIKSACIEFCEKSLLWLADSQTVDLVAGEARYGFSAPTGARVVQPTFATIQDNSIVQVNLSDLNTYVPNWRVIEERLPSAYFMDTADTIRLVGIPTEDIPSALEVFVSLKPSRDATGCPDWIFEDWAEVIASGALSRLHAMVGRVWASKELVSHHYTNFRAGISRAKSKAIKSRQVQTKTMLPVMFGGS